MLNLVLLLCALYTSTAGVVLQPVMERGAVARAFNSTDRGSWNQSGSFSNETSPGIRPSAGPSLNATGQNPRNSSNTALEQDLWPFFAPYNDFLDQCLLWNDQCTGNRTAALDEFFNNSGTLYNVVYGAHCIWSRESECAPWLASPALLPTLLDWLRSPECVQSFDEYHTQHEDEPPWTWSRRIFDGWSIHTIDWNDVATTTSNVGCCGQCQILGGNVDVYYWPVSGANSDCVSIIGSSYNDYVTELLITDDRGYPYWKAQTNPWGQNGSQDLGSITLPPEQALGGAMNPLSVPTNIIQARGYPQGNITIAGNVSISEAIATIGEFQCTSPSICVGFSDLYAADGCGALSTDGELIPYTIIAFAPEELSTIEIPPWVRANVPPKAAIRSFNFADLPCPPQSVMYAMEYKPALGEPYRPVLSAPRRISSLLPEWRRSSCVIPAALFNGVDPPRALKPAEVLVPKVTQALPTPSVAVAAAPASGIQANEPSKTPKPSPTGDNGASSLLGPDTNENGSEVSDPDPGNTPTDASDTNAPKAGNPDPKQANSPSSDPQKTDPQVSNTNDESNGAQDSTSQVSNPDDPTADSSSPDRSQPNAPDNFSNSGNSGNQNPEDPSTDDSTPDASNSNGKDTSSSESQGENDSSPDGSQSNVLDNPSNSPNSGNDNSEHSTQDGNTPNVSDSNGKDTSSSSPQGDDNSSPDRSQPNVPDTFSSSGDSSNADSEDLPPDDSNADISDSNEQDNSSSSPQEEDNSSPDRSRPNASDTALDSTDSNNGDTDDLPPDDSNANISDSNGQDSSSSSPQEEGNSSPDQSRPNIPDTASDSAGSNNEDSEDLSPDDSTTDNSDSNGKDTSSSNSQGDAVVNPDANNPESPTGKSKLSNSQGQNSDSRPNNSPDAEPEADDGNDSDVKGTDSESDPFDTLLTKLYNINPALSPSESSGDGQHSATNDPEHDTSPQPQNSENPPSEDDRNDDEATAHDTLSPQEDAQILSFADSGALANMPSQSALAVDLALSPQRSGNALPTAEFDTILRLLESAAKTEDSVPTNVAAGISAQSASVFSSAILAAGILKGSRSAVPSATLAASSLGPGGDGTSGVPSQGVSVDAVASSKAKSSGSSLFVAKRRPESIISISASKLLYWFCIYALRWLLIFR